MKTLRFLAPSLLGGMLVGVCALYREAGDPSRRHPAVASPSMTVRVVANPSDRQPTANDAARPAATLSPTYVGREVCGECHRENYALHSKHGHHTTFFKTSETELPDVFAGQTVKAGEDYGEYAYEKDEQGNLIAKLVDAKKSKPLDLQYALGSGHNAQTLLSLFVGSDGKTEGLEHRISCYQDNRLDITVGHENYHPTDEISRLGALFDGEPLERCIYCHTTTASVRDGQIENLIANVECEKCHGPGSEHARLAKGNATPPPYSVGHSTWDSESEIQLCGDCHRLPRSVSLEELRAYPDVLVRFQPIGILRSKCHLLSDKGLRCTTCHNPHQSAHFEQEADHIANCVQCHDQNDTTHTICPVSATTNCIECHMPLVDQKQGIQFHDHWIRVRE